jgi:DNA polymerase-3 subunit epsilon/CBS domain-containing protein
MHADGHGLPPCPYAFAVLGSAGRGESLLAMDQDNALIFAEGVPRGSEDRWFEALSVHVADILHEVGVPYCKGGVMAKNPQWRGSVATWQARIGGWISRSQPEDLLAVDIFFDLLGVHGDGGLADRVWREAFSLARGQVGFAKLLAQAAGEAEPGLSWFGGFRTQAGRLDIKKSGLFGIVTTARVLAIRHHVVERSTLARLAGLRALALGGESDLEGLADAQAVFLELILNQQIDDIEHGRPATNAVQVRSLKSRDYKRLRLALATVINLAELTQDLLFED